MVTTKLSAALLQSLGANAHVVGGAVRDRLLGRPTLDLDLIVPEKSEAAAARLAKATGGRAFPLHTDLGIYRVTTAEWHIDIARYQGENLEEDLDRRDLTINALAVPLNAWFTPAWKKKIIDRHGGLNDLAAKRLTPLSKKVFKEDPLRLLRVFRIAAEIGFSISAETKKLIHTQRKLSSKPAGERQREEFLKMFSAERAHRSLVLMDDCGVLDVVFPAAATLRKTAPAYYGKGGVLKHTLDSVLRFEEIMETLPQWFPRTHKKIRAYLGETISGYSRLAHCKWALILHDIGKPKTAKMQDGRLRFFQHEHVGADMVGALSARYRWSSDETNRYARLVRNHMRPGNLATHADDVSNKAIHRFFRDLEDDGISMLLVSLADHLTYLTPAQRKRRNSAHEIVTLQMVASYYSDPKKLMPQKLLTGHHIMKEFKLPPSPLIGKLITEAHEAQVDGKVKTVAQALSFLKPVVERLLAETPEKK